MTKAKDPGTGYEAARDELVGIVAKLEAGGISLEESVALWERGEDLAKVCTGLLDSARQAVAEAESPAATD
jgi:exodeoxyribonuclease VII small subunit